jgi:hypothetical protein
LIKRPFPEGTFTGSKAHLALDVNRVCDGVAPRAGEAPDQKYDKEGHHPRNSGGNGRSGGRVAGRLLKHPNARPLGQRTGWPTRSHRTA